MELLIQQNLQEIRKVNDRVIFLYNRFPMTIHSDRALIDFYLRIFQNITPDTTYDRIIDILWKNKVSFEAISRAGRHLRERYPDRYKRDEDTQFKTMMKESAYIRYYGGVLI